LREWALRLAVEASRPFAFVPLRRLTKSDAALVGDALAMRLIDIAAEASRSLDFPPSAGPIAGDRLWFLDGLDEVPDDVWATGLADALTALDGLKVATCRTAVFASRRASLAEGVSTHWREPIDIMPFNQQERNAFLLARLSESEAAKLAAHINASAALRGLAGFPLLLTLMIGLDLPLPIDRASFYERVEATLGARRARGLSHDHLWSSCSTVLDNLAVAMTLNNTEAPLSMLVSSCDKDQYDLLSASGLLVVSRLRSTFSFLHMTFQEYHFARSLRADGLATALEAYWADARYEEALALLLAMEAQGKDGIDKAAASLKAFIFTGIGSYLDRPRMLRHVPRSPSRVAFHILGRSGVDDLVWPRMRLPFLLQNSGFGMGLAGDVRSPPSVLRFLGGHRNGGVRCSVARNPSTPLESLQRLANDPDHIVRGMVIENPSIPSATLEALAEDSDEHVRSAAQVKLQRRELDAKIERMIASQGGPLRPNAANRASTLRADEVLALDHFERIKLTDDSSTPLAILEILARDPDAHVRASVAHSSSTPPQLLELLARDPDGMVRVGIAMNASTPLPTLTALARDRNPRVRGFAELNPSAALEVAILSEIPRWARWCRRVVLYSLLPLRWIFRKQKPTKAARGVIFAGVREGFLRAAGAQLFNYAWLGILIGAVAAWIAITASQDANWSTSFHRILGQARDLVIGQHVH
jgi:hypothetical protein